MPAISATAPGKIILFGEHAVVYGQPAIAAPVSQVRTRSIITARPDQPRGWINLQAPDIGLEATWNELPGSHPLVFLVKAVLTTLDIEEPPAMTIRVSSTIPIAAGLGSGTAVSVAVIRALSEFLGRPLPNEQVSALAFEVDKLHHGTPSGIDNTTITYEQPVYFSKQVSKQGTMIKTLRVPVPFTIVIADTGTPSSTAEAVGDVRQGWQEKRALYQELFERIGGIADQACRVIESGDVAALGPLMNANQDLLENLRVSSVELDRLVNAARQAGAEGAKLSGGGRGGNMIALAPEGAAQHIADALTTAGAANIIITRV